VEERPKYRNIAKFQGTLNVCMYIYSEEGSRKKEAKGSDILLENVLSSSSRDHTTTHNTTTVYLGCLLGCEMVDGGQVEEYYFLITSQMVSYSDIVKEVSKLIMWSLFSRSGGIKKLFRVM
jgi:hypothetical protein